MRDSQSKTRFRREVRSPEQNEKEKSKNLARLFMVEESVSSREVIPEIAREG